MRYNEAMNNNKVYKPSELASLLNVSHQAVLKWIREGRVTAIRLPVRGYRIPESEVERVVNNVYKGSIAVD